MAFSTNQIHALKRNVKACYVRTRQIGDGRELSYIEGWHAIAEANRIFGHDGWSRETIETKCVLARENKGSFQAVYITKVRITVTAERDSVVREGFGTGEAFGSSAGYVHEKALKTAETDATKRALATFGKPFGLALYVSGRNGRDPGGGGRDQNPHPTSIPNHERRRTQQRLSASGRYYVPTRPTTVLGYSLTDGGNADSASQPPRIAKDAAANNAGPSQDTDPEPSQQDGVELDAPGGEVQVDHAARDAHHQPLVANLAGEMVRPIEHPKRRREPAHLKFVTMQPCLLCGRTPSDAHHLRFAQPRALGRKVSDEFTVPLCRTHHRQLHHSGNEVAWWVDMGIDPLPIAQDLWTDFRNKSARDQTNLQSEIREELLAALRARTQSKKD